MRTTRSSRTRKQRKQRRQRRHMATCRIAGLLAITTFGAGQMVPSSYALLVSQVQTESSVSAAFVFPSTVNEMAQKAVKAVEDADNYSQRAYAELQSCQVARSSADAYTISGGITELLSNAKQEEAAALDIVSQLGAYIQQAQKDVDAAKDEMKSIQVELLAKQDGEPTEGLLREVQLQLLNHQDVNAAVNAAESVLKDAQFQSLKEQDKEIEQKVQALIEQYKLLSAAGFTGEMMLKLWWQPSEIQNEIVTKVKSAQDNIHSSENVLAYITSALDIAKETPQKVGNSIKAIEAAASMASESAKAKAQAEAQAAAAAPQGGGSSGNTPAAPSQGGGGSSNETPHAPPQGGSGGSNGDTPAAPAGGGEGPGSNTPAAPLQGGGDAGKDVSASTPQGNGGDPGKDTSAPSQDSGGSPSDSSGGSSSGGSSSGNSGGSSDSGSSSSGSGGSSGGGSSSGSSAGGSSGGNAS